MRQRPRSITHFRVGPHTSSPQRFVRLPSGTPIGTMSAREPPTTAAARSSCPMCQASWSPRAPHRFCPNCSTDLCLSDPVAEDSLPTIIARPGGAPQSPTPVLFEHDTTDSLIGSDLGVYRIQSLLGRGAMGRVYLAEHRDLNRLC